MATPSRARPRVSTTAALNWSADWVLPRWVAVIDYRAVQSLRLRELPVPSPVGLVGARERRTGGVVVGLSGEPPLMIAIARDGTRDPSLARASPEG